jgi:hypothetical protein
MKQIYYTYNNEAIACCTILSFLNISQSADLARCCLILPFLFDDRTVNYLNGLREGGADLALIIKEKPRLFTSFNNRFLSLLPVTINSLIILSRGNQIKIEKNISIVEKSSFIGVDMGERFNNIERVMPVVDEIFSRCPTNKLYEMLNVEL